MGDEQSLKFLQSGLMAQINISLLKGFSLDSTDLEWSNDIYFNSKYDKTYNEFMWTTKKLETEI